MQEAEACELCSLWTFWGLLLDLIGRLNLGRSSSCRKGIPGETSAAKGQAWGLHRDYIFIFYSNMLVFAKKKKKLIK